MQTKTFHEVDAGKNLTRIMEEKNVSIHTLADKTYLSKNTVRRLRRNKIAGNLLTWYIIANALSVDISELFKD